MWCARLLWVATDMAFAVTELDRSGWSLGSEAFAAVTNAVAASGISPSRILEFGSGASTRAFATSFPDAAVVSVDHDGTWLPQLDDLPRPERVDLHVVSLKLRTIHGVPSVTYDFRPTGAFDIALVDGPPRRLGSGRLGAMLLAYDALRPGGFVFLDDAYRPSELRAIARLAEMTGERPRFLDVGHGLALFRRGAQPRVRPAVALGAGLETLHRAVAMAIR
jgi:predicted O-methyltransferase YrrM